MFIVCLYWLASVAVALAAFSSGGMTPGLCALGTSALAFIAGVGLKGTIYGSWRRRLAGLCLALVSMGIAHWLGTGFSVNLLGVSLGGTEWGWLSFFISLLLISKRMGRRFVTWRNE
jgi:hypothetical protein